MLVRDHRYMKQLRLIGPAKHVRCIIRNRCCLSQLLYSLLVSALITTGCASDANTKKIRIDVRQSDDVVRRQLLHYTPLGSSADTVIDFVLSQLYYEGVYGSGIGITPEPDLGVRLGHRYDNPPFGHRAVEAHWKFDNSLRLRDIEIRPVLQEGGYSHTQDSDPRPKIKVNLRQSDEMIKKQMLEHTPPSSDRAFVENFIGTRLYFEGGPVNGRLLTNRPGTAVILGHYFDDRMSKEIAVRLVWEFDKKDQLRGVEVRRVDSLRPVLSQPE